MELVETSYKLSSSLPNEERYGLRSQLTRAADSIVLNIAEGSAKSSTKEYKRYLETALGSAFEVETVLLIIERLGIAKNDAIEMLMTELLAEQRMINSFISKLKEV